MRGMRFLVLIGMALSLTTAQASARPQRILSLNVCADQYLLALADVTQIAAVSEFAADPTMSAAAARASGLPTATRNIELLLAFRPDLILTDVFYPPATVAAARQRGIKVVTMRSETGFADVVANARLIAAAVGHPARGKVLVNQMQAELARVGRPGRGRTIAHYQRRGFVTGTGTLLDAMMTRVGLVNLAGRRGIGPLGRLSLEEIALARPDFVLIDDDIATVRDQGAEMLTHPLLEKAVPASRRIAFPSAYTVCGGPHYPRAAALLANRIAHSRKRSPP